MKLFTIGNIFYSIILLISILVMIMPFITLKNYKYCVKHNFKHSVPRTFFIILINILFAAGIVLLILKGDTFSESLKGFAMLMIVSSNINTLISYKADISDEGIVCKNLFGGIIKEYKWSTMSKVNWKGSKKDILTFCSTINYANMQCRIPLKYKDIINKYLDEEGKLIQ